MYYPLYLQLCVHDVLKTQVFLEGEGERLRRGTKYTLFCKTLSRFNYQLGNRKPRAHSVIDALEKI